MRGKEEMEGREGRDEKRGGGDGQYLQQLSLLFLHCLVPRWV